SLYISKYLATCGGAPTGPYLDLAVRNLPSGAPINSGQGTISGTLDLSDYVGSMVALCFFATDVAGQSTVSRSGIYVEDNKRLAIAEEAPGWIDDVDDRRTLAVDTAASGDSVLISDRVSGVTTNVPLPANLTVREAYLTSSGAAFIGRLQTQTGTALDNR